MSAKHKPATPLPWDTFRTEEPTRNAVMQNGYVFAEVQGTDYRRDPVDTDYIVLAANAYPKLVEKLKRLHHIVYAYQEGKAANILSMPEFKDGEELLRELGEE